MKKVLMVLFMVTMLTGCTGSDVKHAKELKEIADATFTDCQNTATNYTEDTLTYFAEGATDDEFVEFVAKVKECGYTEIKFEMSTDDGRIYEAKNAEGTSIAKLYFSHNSDKDDMASIYIQKLEEE